MCKHCIRPPHSPEPVSQLNCCHFLYCCQMNYLPNDFSFPVSLGIFGMKLPFKKHQLNLQTSTGPSWCLFPYYFSLCERILRRIRQRCRLVVIDVLHRNPNILKYLKQSLSVMSECNRSVMRIILLDQNVTVETSHLMNGKYANASERPGCNRKDFSLCHIRAQLIVGSGLQAVECDIARCNISLKGTVCYFDRKASCHDHLVFHLTGCQLL